jgi:membrane-bound serine protease (ClpP class)
VTKLNLRILFLALLATSFASGARAQEPSTVPATAPASQPSLADAVIVGLDGEINEFTRASLIKRIEEARALGAGTVVIRLNTPGGMVGPALEITRYLKRQDDLRIIAYVDEMAYSAGAMIAVACDQIYMQPGSFVGDCAPIIPGQSLEGAERAKAESPLLAEFRDSAVRNGYDPLLAQSMVQYGIVVHYVENGEGEKRFVTDDDYKRLIEDGWKAVEGVRNPVDGPNELLTVNADEAQRLGLCRGQYVSADALANALGMNVLATLEPSGGEQIIGFLSSSAVRGILGVVFMLALFSAFRTPGMGHSEAIAVGALAVMVGVPLLTGYAQWYEIVAILLGIILLAVELFILPGFGVTGITGICLVLLGLVLTFVPAEPVEFPGGWLPTMPQTQAALKEGAIVVVGGMTCALLLWLWLQRYLPKLPYVNRLILTATVGGNATVTDSPVPGAVEVVAWPAVGAVGAAVTDLRPGGAAEFRDDTIDDNRVTDVVSESGFLVKGSKVIVREVRGNRIVVRAA